MTVTTSSAKEEHVHPFLSAQLAVLHQNDLRRDVAAARAHNGRQHSEHTSAGETPADVVIRRATAADGPALAALSALDAAPMPFGPALIAEVSGSPLAVLPLDGPRAFGDPFRPTEALVELLELRAAQLRSEEAPRSLRRSLLAWTLPAALRRIV
jgi:hypothetical protein